MTRLAGLAICIQIAASACGGGVAPARRGAVPASGPPVRGGTLKVIGRSDVDHLATTSAYTATTWQFFRAFTRQLVAYPVAPDFVAASTLAADLAEALPTIENGGLSADGRVYTFHLKRGVRWNTTPAREVTAGDQVRALKLLCNPVNPVGAPGYFTGTIAGMRGYCDGFAKVAGTVADIRAYVDTHEIAGVSAPDDHTVVLRLLDPAPDFLNIMALPFGSPVPVEYLDYLPDSPEFRQHTLSDGPYAITRYLAGREMLLERNPAWDSSTDPLRPAYVDRIQVILGMDQQLVQLQLEAGTADTSWDQIMPTAELGSLLAIEDPNVLLPPQGDYFPAFRYMAFNLVGSNNGSALKNVKVRQAVEYAVNKVALVQILGGPAVARPLGQSVMKAATGYEDGADWYVTSGDRGDADRARRLLSEAGHPNGLALSLVYMNVGAHPMVAATVQESLSRMGINVTLMPYTPGDFYGRLLSNPENARRGVWDLALVGWVPDWYGASNGRSMIEPLYDGRNFTLGTTNVGGYDSPVVNGLIDRATVATTTAEAAALWKQAARRVMEDAAIVPLVEYKQPYYHASRVQDCNLISIFNFNCDSVNVWIDSKTSASR